MKIFYFKKIIYILLVFITVFGGRYMYADSYTEFNGIDAYAELGNTYTIGSDGDYIEFQAKWNDMASAYSGTLGLFGVAGGTNQTIGFQANDQLSIRGTSNTWMNFSGLSTNEAVFNTYRLVVNNTDLELYINGDLSGTTTLINPFSISHIGNTYNPNFTNASVRSFEIHSDIDGDLESDDIINDFTCVNCTQTTINDLPKVNLSGNPVIVVALDSTFTDPGATATDLEDGSITPVVSGTVDTSITGSYTVTYTATDSDSGVGTAERTVEVVLGSETEDLATRFNGTSSYANLGNTYTIGSDGDYIEFQAKWNDMASAYSGTLGLFGVAGGTNQTFGFETSNKLSVRGESSTWMSFTDLTVNGSVFNTYRLIVNNSDLDLYLNGELVGSTPLINPFSIENIGNTYGSNFTSASVRSFEIHSDIDGDLESNDIINDFTCVNCISETVFERNFEESNLLVDVKENRIDIYIPQPENETYIKYEYRHDVDTEINADVWRVGLVKHVDSKLAEIRTLTNDGAWENAIQITGADDFMGGKAHGDEKFTDFIFEIDGDVTSVDIYGMRRAQRVDFFKDSDLFAPSGLVNVGEKVATAEKEWNFTLSGTNTLKNKVTWLSSEDLYKTYMFMLTILRSDDDGQITDTAKVSPLYDETDVTNIGHSDPHYTGSEFGGNAIVYGKESGVFAEVDIKKGWKPTSVYNTSPAIYYNKMYFDFTGDGYQTEIGEIFETEADFIVGVFPDTKQPKITLNGSDTMTIRTGSSFTDPGATAFDNRDKKIPVTVSGDTVDIDTVGKYSITYNAIDSNDNSADETIRHVYVEDSKKIGSRRVSADRIAEIFDTKETSLESSSINNNEVAPEGQCSDQQKLTQNLRSPSRNGQYDSYTGAIVTEAHILQQHLNRLGFNTGPEDGIIGVLTKGAILRMQEHIGTFADGYVGPLTREILNHSC